MMKDYRLSGDAGVSIVKKSWKQASVSSFKLLPDPREKSIPVNSGGTYKISRKVGNDSNRINDGY